MTGSSEPWVRAYRHPGGSALDLPPLSLPALFEAAVERRGNAPLLDTDGRTYSYDEIAALVRRVATGLIDAGIRPGDRIGLCLPNVPQHVAAYYGALRAGAVIVPYSPLQPADALLRQIEHSGTRLLFVMEGWALAPRATELLDASLLERLVLVSVPETLPRRRALTHRLLRRGKSVSPPSDPRISTFQTVVDNDGLAPAAAIDPERDLALIHYAGGPSDRPHGASFSHQAVTANARQINAIDPRNARDHPGEIHRTVAAVPLSNVLGHACVLTRAIYDGGEIVLPPSLSAQDVITAIARTRPTCIAGTPALYEDLLAQPLVGRTDFSALRAIVSSGAPLPLDLRDRFQEQTGVAITEGYGLIEAGIVACNPIQGISKPGSVGQPLPATRVALVACEDVTRAPASGQPGEIIVRGPQIMAGYWREPAEDVFVELGGHRWLRTGDIGSIDDEGYVRVVDRLSDLFAVGGVLVYPGQIEAILRRHAAVAETLVVGLSEGGGERVPVAFVTPIGGGGAIEGEALRRWLNPQLGRHEQVARVVLRENLPRTLAGALSRHALMIEHGEVGARGPAAA